MKTLSIAHRGASGKFPENTLLAFKEALNSRCDGIELDVHLSLDGQIIVFHDDHLFLNAAITRVADLSYDELRSISLSEKQHIPLLTEVLDLIDKQCLVNIELKGLDTAKAVATIVQTYITDKKWTYNHFLISSFSEDLLVETKFLNPEINLAIITHSDLEDAFEFAKYLKVTTIVAHFEIISKANLNRVHAAGFKIFAWTVNNQIDIKNLKTIGIDGIISDFPERI